MEKFTSITATACPRPAENIDTDQILPARYLKLPRKGEHGKVLFQDFRFDAESHERPDFPLNRLAWRTAKIIVGGRNFGGGSSREAAVYALFDYGIHRVIASSFGDIFSQNATKNGLLTAVVSEAESGALIAALTFLRFIGRCLDFGQIAPQLLLFTAPQALFSPEFGWLSPTGLNPCHVGQLVCDALMAINARAFATNKEPRMDLGGAPRLFGKIHCDSRVAVSTFQRVVGFHARPFVFGKIEAHI
jgi:3-isopropylmalate dehydratase small subunit